MSVTVEVRVADSGASIECQSQVDNESREPAPRARRHENSEYSSFVDRMIRAYGKRVADGDLEDLTEMLAKARRLDEAIAAAVDGLRSQSWSWESIGRAASMTRQAAQQRWGDKS